MVASRRKAPPAKLLAEGAPPARPALLSSTVGLPIGALAAEAIAVSILAGIVAARRARAAQASSGP